MELYMKVYLTSLCMASNMLAAQVCKKIWYCCKSCWGELDEEMSEKLKNKTCDGNLCETKGCWNGPSKNSSTGLHCMACERGEIAHLVKRTYVRGNGWIIEHAPLRHMTEDLVSDAERQGRAQSGRYERPAVSKHVTLKPGSRDRSRSRDNEAAETARTSDDPLSLWKLWMQNMKAEYLVEIIHYGATLLKKDKDGTR